MSKKKETIYFLIVLVVGCISFVNARVTSLNRINETKENSQSWLSDAPLSVAESEAEFNNEVSGLITVLKEMQANLIDALDNPQTSNETILEQVDYVNAAHEDLIRKVGQHIVYLRNELGQENQEQLMQFCAEAISAPMKRLGARNNAQTGRGGNGFGRQNRGQRGFGAGFNQQQFRFWNRLTNRLRLTPEQLTQIQEADPNFAAESNLLYEELINERQNLLSVFENPQSSDEELLEQIDNLISTHSRVERKIAEHVLVLRSYLTIEQQKWLIGLCRSSQN